MTGAVAIETLTTAFDRAFADLGQDQRRDAGVVVASAPAIPLEIVRAAGFRPVVARGAPGATPAADAHLEAGIFPPRIRHLIDAALGARLAAVARIVIPRTSDPDYKCFLYLREFERMGVALPPACLFDLLQSPGALIRAYDADRTRALLDDLVAERTTVITDDELRHEIRRANAARAAARRLLDLRRGAPRVAGAVVLPLVGALWQTDPDDYVRLAGMAADTLGQRPPLRGPRLLLAGAPLDTAQLHATIESFGTVVVAEVSPWGSGAAGEDVRVDDNPIAAIADRYRIGTLGARMPACDLERWIERALVGVDGVVVWLPVDDATFGWDYPALRDLLDARGIPHVRLDGDLCAPLTADARERLARLAERATKRQEADRG